MTDEQIIELAFACGFSRETLMDKSMYDVDAWVSTLEELLKFALLIHEDGYNKGYDDSKSSSFKGFHTCLDD